MANNVAIGIQDFEKLIVNECFYVDKTMFIKEWWESKDEVTLINRPRRFGKTLNMSMLEKFFSVEYADREDLFEKFAIWKEESYRKLQGTYPVISLSFARIKSSNYETAQKAMNMILADLYKSFYYLLDGGKLNETDVQYFKSVSDNMEENIAAVALNRLSGMLYRHYGKKVLILLDEYDTPMQEAFVGGYWEKIGEFIRSMFNATFKTNPCLERAVLTGITRISKESIFSDLNNLKVVTTTSNEYATAFGFTEEEVFASLEACGLEAEKADVKRWYDGFVFGTYKEIYNPWSILNFLDKGTYETYWANTSANSLVSKLLREGNREIKEKFEALLRGETLETQIDEQIVYSQLAQNETAIWSLLLASGYFKVIDYQTGARYGAKRLYKLDITNFETRCMFENMVSGWFNEVHSDYNYFIKAMLRDDVEEMNAYMRRIFLNSVSYFDTGGRSSGEEPERFYHGFVLGLLVDLREEYIITSNQESGFGRYDVMLEPRNPAKGTAIILEFKVQNRKKEISLEDTVAEALKQIEKKQYVARLLEHGIPEERIKKYGFAFSGKKVLIG